MKVKEGELRDLTRLGVVTQNRHDEANKDGCARKEVRVVSNSDEVG